MEWVITKMKEEYEEISQKISRDFSELTHSAQRNWDELKHNLNDLHIGAGEPSTSSS